MVNPGPVLCRDPIKGFELNLELTYRAEVRPGFDVQPVLTHI